MRHRHYLWQLRPYFRQTVGQLLLGSLSGIVMNTAVVLPAILLGRAIDAVILYSKNEITQTAVAWAIALFALGTLATELPRVGKRWWLMTANARIRASLRSDALRGLLAWPIARLNATPIGDSMARITGDVETLGVGVREFIIETWDTLLFLLSFFVAMLLLDAPLTLLALSPVPFAMALAWRSGRWIRARTTTSRAANSALTGGLQEYLAGARALRLLGMRNAAQKRVTELAQAQARANIQTALLRSVLPALYTTLMAAGVPLVFWLGGQRVLGGVWSVGAFIAYLDLFLRFTGRGFRVPQLINSIQSGSAAYDRLAPLLATPAPLTTRDLRFSSFRAGYLSGATAVLPAAERVSSIGPLRVSLRDMSFAYTPAGALVLEDISLEIPAGAFVAVTGPVGCGKSALAKTLLGLYPLSAGQVLLNDDEPARHRGAIGYLPQESALFSGSVRDNIDFGRAIGATAEQRASAVSMLTRDLSTFPDGIDSQIGERGIRVSGGQRQRIALARAIAAEPRLLVLDDPFSAVDVNTEVQIITGLQRAFGPHAALEKRATLVLCSHRLAAFPGADLIVVLDKGRIIERGTHANLLKTGGMYARIFAAQAILTPP